MDMEEESSRDRNTRIADEHLAEVCREWLAWLDDDNGTLSAGRKVSEDMVHMMQRTPVAPLCRAVAMAVEAASHRLAKDRAQLATMREQTHDYQEQLLACNSHASQLESSLRSELEAKVAELDNLNEQLKHLQRSHQDLTMDHGNASAELKEVKERLHSSQSELEAGRIRDTESKQQIRSLMEKEKAQQAELERVMAAHAKSDAERQAFDRSVRSARSEIDALTQAREQLQAQLQEETEARSKERRHLEDTLNQTRGEFSALQAQHQRTLRQFEEGEDTAREELQRVSAELRDVQAALQKTKESLKLRDAELREANSRVQEAVAESENVRNQQREELRMQLRVQHEREASLKADLDWAKAAASKAEAKYLASEKGARKARWEADTANEERRWLESELEKQAQSRTKSIALMAKHRELVQELLPPS